MEYGVSWNKDITYLHPFRRRHSLKPRHDYRVESEGLIDACLEVFKLAH